MSAFSHSMLMAGVLFVLINPRPVNAAQTPAQAPPAAPKIPVPKPTPPAPGAVQLTLPEAEQMALKNNPRIAAAQFRARAYDEIVSQVRAAYYPTLGGSVTAVGADSGSRLAAGGLNNSVLYNRAAAGLSINQLVTDFGRTNSLVRSAAYDAQAQREGINYSKADLLLNTDAAYFAVLRARTLLTVARETVNARQDVVDRVTALFQSKLKSSLDVSFANVNLADAQLLLSTAENDVQSAEASLSRLLTLPGDTRFQLADPQSNPNPLADANTFIQQALQKRPDLIQRRLELQSSQEAAHAASLLSRPTVGVLGAAGYVPAREAAVRSRYGAVGMNVSIPIFNGGLFRARQFEAESQYAAGQKLVQDLELRIKQDVRIAWLNVNTAFERLGLTQKLLDQARMALDLAQARYNLGLSTIVELSQSQLQYTSAELARARAQYDYAAQLSILNYQAGLIL